MRFLGRNLVIATMHMKENVIAPILEDTLGVKTCVPENFNSDVFGTFSGEIERKSDPISTAKQKCLLAMDISNCDVAVASEGSFGPHPSLHFAHANEEILYFLDRKNELEIVARTISFETNFNGQWITNEFELKEFAEKSFFPSHGLILRSKKEGTDFIKKGILDSVELQTLFANYKDQFGGAYVETDMRACYNPLRMAVIKETTTKLVHILQSECPNCELPGFDVQEVIPGLPCSLCSTPTRSTLAYLYRCKSCNEEKKQLFPNKKQTEDPMYCDRCNP